MLTLIVLRRISAIAINLEILQRVWIALKADVTDSVHIAHKVDNGTECIHNLLAFSTLAVTNDSHSRLDTLDKVITLVRHRTELLVEIEEVNILRVLRLILLLEAIDELHILVEALAEEAVNKDLTRLREIALGKNHRTFVDSFLPSVHLSPGRDAEHCQNGNQQNFLHSLHSILQPR